MERVKIDLKGRSYNIDIGKGSLKNLKSFIDGNGEKSFIITDKNVDALYGGYVNELKNYKKLVIEPGEQSKSFVTVENILKEMLAGGATRKSRIIALGGGVVGDVAGFCSSIYMRGISFIQIPTTLLAQVDSSVGGKTGINLLHYKNSIGSFYQPETVIIDTDLLHTLSSKERLSGIGEIIKYGVIYDYEFLKYIVKNIKQLKECSDDLMPYIIKRCCEIKGQIVSRDEKEAGLRKILNFGHTIGHALEGITEFSKYTHGEAVIIGMYYETLMAKKMNIIDESYAEKLLEFLDDLGVNLDISNHPIAELIDWMLKDKKNTGGKISFILPVAKGKMQEYLLKEEELTSGNLV